MLVKPNEDEWGDLFTVGLGFVIGGVDNVNGNGNFNGNFNIKGNGNGNEDFNGDGDWTPN